MSATSLWPFARAENIAARARSFVARGEVSCVFLPSNETDFIKYFSSGAESDLSAAARAPFHFVPAVTHLADAQILIVTSHGMDLSSQLWDLRRKVADDAIVIVWLWDNHVGHLNNIRTALAADLIFPSHLYASHYLANPVSVTSAHVAACTAQWTREDVAQFFMERVAVPRLDKLLVNYVDYSFSWRAELIRRIATEIPEADVLLMPENDRTRYFSKTPSQRFAEWASYKATLILPIDNDLSTRVFDALIAGLVPVVPRRILDFDKVVSPPVQEALGIVRIDSVDLPLIRAGAIEAIRRYDWLGPEGAMARHRYALEQHSLVNRILAMLETVRQLGSGEIDAKFVNDAGLYMSADI